MKKHKYTHTHITHHKDGSHTIHHVHEEGPHADVTSGAADHDSMVDHLMHHTSDMNPGEMEAEKGPAPAAPAPGMPGAMPTPGA